LYGLREEGAAIKAKHYNYEENYMKWNLPRHIGLTVAAMTFFASVSAHADFSYTDFSDVSGLTLNGTTSQAGNALRLTNATYWNSGSVFTTQSTSLGALNSFSTYFQFRITNSGGDISDASGPGADGIVFVVQTVSNNVGGSGGSIGYGGINNSVGIEFDTFDNGPGGSFNDPNGNHVGIDVNGNIASIATVTEPTLFNNGNVWNAWVDYNGATNLLEVRWAQTTSRPLAAQLSSTIDLVDALGQDTAYLGFTSGTGLAWGTHEILSWEYRDSFSPITTVPEPNTYALMILGFGLIGSAALRKTRKN
jgi:hypothetical protein